MPKAKKQRTYLVVLRTNLDELPILLTQSSQRAYGKARSVTEEEANESANVMGVDHAGRICTAVITFADGQPEKLVIVKDWEEQNEAA